MRLTEWQSRSAHPDSMAAKVMGPATDALALLGAGRNPHSWIAWGDDPGIRYTILALAPAGLAVVNVRVNVPGEGPRASGKMVRWHRVQVGELSVEIQGAHRLITFQLESQLLHGANDDADDVAAFVDSVFAAIDGRSTTLGDRGGLPDPSSGPPPFDP
jgi:hypothetical protein